MTELLSFILDHEQFRKPRLPSLYSDFRPLRTNNPNGFLANLTAWKSALSEAAAKGVLGNDTLILSLGEELVGSLSTREWGRPLALGTVFNEAVAAKEFIPMETFLKMKVSAYYRPWVDPWKVLGWALEVAGLRSPVVEDRGVQEGTVVVLKNLEEAAKIIIKNIARKPNHVDRIFSTEMLLQEFQAHGMQLSENDLKAMIVFLTRDLREASIANKTIKFKNPDGELTPVTEHDVTIATLKTLIASLHHTVEALSTKVSSLDVKARIAVKTNNRLAALAALRSKKMAEGSLESRVRSLGQLEEVLVKIEQAADNVELVRTLESSSKVLAGLNKRVGGVEHADRVVDELREQMDETEEVSRIIVEEGGQVDEEDVEDEFEGMLKEEERKAKTVEDAEGLEREKRKAREVEAKREPAGITGSMEELDLRTDTPAPVTKELEGEDRVAIPAS